MPVYTAPKKGVTDFTAAQESELETLRAYVFKLRDLKTALATEFPESKELSKINLEIDRITTEIISLEMLKVKSQFVFNEYLQ